MIKQDNPKAWPQDKINSIKSAIDVALQNGANPIAAFDADGTLWNMDMGENFFDYKIQKKLLATLPPDPWQAYHQMKEIDEPTAFLWLAQIAKGIPEEKFRLWAEDAVRSVGTVPLFDGVKEVITHLLSKNVEVFIVTASIKWAVEPGANLFGVPKENVIGIKTHVENGLLTDRQHGPITWREGKVSGILEATGGKKPFFAAGNTMGDLALLESATHLRLANCATKHGHVNFETEQKLLAIAKERGWFHHTY